MNEHLPDASRTGSAAGDDHEEYGAYEGGGWSRSETTGGALLILGAVIALAWANSPWGDAYVSLSETVVGPSALHLDLSLSTWAADGLLAIFFFVVGVELKTEFVTGSLRDPRKAGMPMIAAVGGMILPATIYLVVQLVAGSDALVGWAIPTATDIAFALAVLAVVGRGLPTALRTFLLTLAVVDDLLAITIIAVFYTADLSVLFLVASLAVIAVFGVLVQRRVTSPLLLVPIALVAWGLMHEAGVHATVAGVLLGFTVPAIARAGEGHALTHVFEYRVRPLSQVVALPVFAFFAAGVAVADAGGLGNLVTEPVPIGVGLGLVLGKVLGIWGTVGLLDRFTGLRLEDDLHASDLLPIALLAGIGFTVSLLISELAFGADSEFADEAKLAILLASVLSALLASVMIRLRVRAQR